MFKRSMAKGTREGLRNKDDGSHSSRKSLGGREEMSNASTRTSPSSSKQSAKGASEQTTSIASVRKSKRFAQQTPPTTPITRKSKRLVNQSTPSPLRRSDRGKNNCSSSPSGSNHSGKSFSSVDARKKKDKKEKSIKQLTMESGKRVSSEKYDQGSSSLKRKRMDARSYKSLFKTQKRRYSISDSDKKLEKQDLPEVDNIESGDGDPKSVGDMEDGDHKCDQAVLEHGAELVEGTSGAAPPGSASSSEDIDANVSVNNVEEKVSSPSREHDLLENSPVHLDVVDGDISKMSCTIRATLDEASKRIKDYSSADILKIPESVASTNVERSACSDTCSESTDPSGKSKSMTSTRNLQSKVAGNEFCKDVIAGACLPRANLEEPDITGSCSACDKKRRLSYDSTEEELCSCTAVEKDTGDVEAFSSECVRRYDHVTGLHVTLSNAQTDDDGNVCVKCKQPGELLHCCGRGCKRCYHLSCLDPILYDAPPGVWHCSYCSKKKIEFGIYTVTKGVESIWDSREVVVAHGTHRQKQYLIKYQGLAHVYNHWISESQLLLETPSLVTKYNDNNQRIVWNLDWTVPSRLLRKRPLISPEPEDNCTIVGSKSTSDCRYEWLVKWCGLDYVHATWELENASFLQSPQGEKLIREYGIRFEKAKRVVDKSAKGSSVKLQRLLAGGSASSDECYLHNVIKLRELWYKNQNAVVFDEQERFANVIFFILSLSNDHQPFLIASTSESLSHWQAEFMRLAPSIDVVVYKGNIDTRSSIRALEFHEEDKDGIMLQVLLSPIEVVLEDLQFLKWLKWKVIVIDECQRAYPDMKKMKLLDTDMRLLLFSGPVKDTAAEYLSLLSLLGSPDDLDKAHGSKSETVDNLVKLKENLSRFSAYSRFVEYLVPAELSNLQLEQYCAMLLANATVLRSNSKTDEVGAFKEILMTLRKCCDHPYIVDSSLQPSLIAGLSPDQGVEVGVKASGKLRLLNDILSRIRDQRLKALVLFQSIVGSAGIAIGDILDDFVRAKFGQNSYERIDACLISSKKQAALNRFNEIGNEQFVFLFENRACHPSIKLSVDTVIIFDSDWNPANDLKALQRLSIHSQSERINVFRLYSSCTIEEKALILGKQNHNLESNLQNIKCSSSLLMWGAACLFSRLDEYHAGNSTDSAADISSGQKVICDVVSELSAVLSGQFEKNDEGEPPIISKVIRSGTTYNTSCSLLGEKKVQSTDMEEPHIFWKRLLEGKNPRWKFASGSTPRSRKRVQYAEESARKSENVNDDAGRKRKKVSFSASSVQLVQEENQVAGFNEGTPVVAAISQSRSSPVSVALGSNMVNEKNAASSLSTQRSDSNRSGMAHLQANSPSDDQESLHAFVKTDIVKLCEILKLSKEVEQMIDRFLEYVMENHQVNKERASILQALQISVCWTAASILKQKVDKKYSLELAKRLLNFKCTEDEVIFVYRKLRLLKKTFLQLPATISGLMSENLISALDVVSPRSAPSTGEQPSGSFSLQDAKAEVKVRSGNQNLPHGQEPNSKLTGNDFEKTIKKIQKKCDKRMSKLHLKHEKEIQEFHKMWAEKKEKLESDHQKELTFVKAMYGTGPIGKEKLKMLDVEFAKKMVEHERLKELQLKELEAKHSAATEEERRKICNWTAETASCSNECRFVNEMHIHGSESEDGIEFSIASPAVTGKGTETDVSPCKLNFEEQGLDRIVQAAQESDTVHPSPPVASAVEAVAHSIPSETVPIILNTNSERESETGGVETSFIPRVEQCKEGSDFSQCMRSPEKHVIDEVPLTRENGVMPSGDSGNTGPETGNANVVGTSTSLNTSTSKALIVCEHSLINQGNEMAPGVSGNAESDMGHDHAVKESTPTRSNVGKGRGNSLTSEITRNQKDQLDGSAGEGGVTNPEVLSVYLTDSLPPVPVTGNETITVGIVHSAPFDVGANPHSNCEEVTENSRQLEQASEEIAPGSSPPPVAEAVHQDHSNGINCLLNSVDSSHLQEESVEVSDQPKSQDADNMMLRPPMELGDSAQGLNNPDSLTTSIMNHEMNNQHSAHSQSTEVQVNQNAAELQSLTASRALPNLQSYGNHRAASWNTTVPSLTDPLQNELERIRKDIEQATKLYESTNLQLESDCEKEIEEMAAQIRKKYEAKRKDAETALVLKKTELDSNQNKVLMNKILAEAFRSKCLDLRPSGISGMHMQQAVMQHLHQLALRPSRRHSPVNSQQHTVNPSMQSSHHPRGNFSGLSRPPVINAITPSIINARVGGEVRCPAPHLQPFRPASTSSSNMMALPCNPNQQVSVNVPVTSPLLPTLSSQQALVISSTLMQPNPRSPAPQPTVKINQSQVSESDAVVQPCPQNVHNQLSGHAVNTLPCSPRPGSNSGAVEARASDVVCLSDDDE